jgi:hypothetical protein
VSRGRRKVILERQVALRAKLWPHVTDDDLWLRNVRDGFATLPRAMPIICTIMDGMTKGTPVSTTYLDLWFRAMDEMFIQLPAHPIAAFGAGFEGERAVRTWRDRMKKLSALGFIDIKPGAIGDMHYVLIFNPYHVLRRHHAAKHPAITDARFTALLARAHEIGATDMDDIMPADPLVRPPLAAGTKEDFSADLNDEIPW